MTAVSIQQPFCENNLSGEPGWDNPFRPGGDLSREADEIVNLIKDGKPITPTNETKDLVANGSAQKDKKDHDIQNGNATIEEVTKSSSKPLNTAVSPQPKKGLDKQNGSTKQPSSQTQVSNQIIPGPTSASHVVIEDKKKKRCACCVIQ